MAASIAGHRVKTSPQHRKGFVLHRSDENKVRGWPQPPERGAGLPWLSTGESSMGGKEQRTFGQAMWRCFGVAGGPVWGSARSRFCPHSRGQEAGGFPAPSPPPWARLPHEPPAAAGADGKQGSRRSAGRNLQPGRSSLRGGLLAQGSSSHSAQGLRFVKRPRTAERIKSTPRA